MMQGNQIPVLNESGILSLYGLTQPDCLKLIIPLILKILKMSLAGIKAGLMNQEAAATVIKQVMYTADGSDIQ
jgi:hypothetical protein